MDALDLPLKDELVNLALMHRDVHFGGKFSFMIEYYEQEGKGIHPDLSLDLLRNLEQSEKKLKQNLAPLLLSGSEAEEVTRAKKAYEKLSDVYDNKEKAEPIAILIADLILSEEEEPLAEIEALINEQLIAVQALIKLIKNEEFYSPLFPGYGQAPHLAVMCLKRLADERSIPALFELIGKGNVVEEETILLALKEIGTPAKDFLLKAVKATPITEDNERAAVALINFREDPEVSLATLQLLEDSSVRKKVPLSTFLTLCCKGLQSEEEKNRLKEIVKDPDTPSILDPDLTYVINSWKKK